mmetsp:Transcript_122866/g.348286  ORF Transcript_122866/g.348286 Transcript_122866/m.348286 type:complete len:234 (+) Transcript_122866:409-1110(+)
MPAGVGLRLLHEAGGRQDVHRHEGGPGAVRGARRRDGEGEVAAHARPRALPERQPGGGAQEGGRGKDGVRRYGQQAPRGRRPPRRRHLAPHGGQGEEGGAPGGAGAGHLPGSGEGEEGRGRGSVHGLRGALRGQECEERAEDRQGGGGEVPEGWEQDGGGDRTGGDDDRALGVGRAREGREDHRVRAENRRGAGGEAVRVACHGERRRRPPRREGEGRGLRGSREGGGARHGG